MNYSVFKVSHHVVMSCHIVKSYFFLVGIKNPMSECVVIHHLFDKLFLHYFLCKIQEEIEFLYTCIKI